MWRISGRNFAVDRRVISLTHSFGVTPQFSSAKYYLASINYKTPSIVWCKDIAIWNCLGVTHDGQSDGQTDRHSDSK